MLYVRDGVIVGGGLMLNQPGDMTPQGMVLIGSGFDVGPGRPITEDLGRRDKVCPDLTWPQVWSAPQRYEVVLVQGRVPPRPDVGPDHLLLDIPTLGYWPLIVARTRLQAYGARYLPGLPPRTPWPLGNQVHPNGGKDRRRSAQRRFCQL
ncbi:MAG: hypothetical protein QOE61_5036 [Micromonosporaceae bacterium]|nr:hypothetical protein [Micromonosporaceae bacterium]